MKILIAALLSVAIFWLTPTETPKQNLNNSTTKPAKAKSLAVATEQEPAEVANQAPEPQPPIVVEPVQVSHPIGCENYRQLISQYDWNTDVMLSIMKAESSCNPSAIGDNYQINGLHAPSCGLLQIRTLASRPSCEELKDPATNIAWAYRIYQGQGFFAWSVCRHTVSCS